MGIFCPKCGHQRTAEDDPLIPETTCPKCGVVYAKFLKMVGKENQFEQPIEKKPASDPVEQNEKDASLAPIAEPLKESDIKGTTLAMLGFAVFCAIAVLFSLYSEDEPRVYILIFAPIFWLSAYFTKKIGGTMVASIFLAILVSMALSNFIVGEVLEVAANIHDFDSAKEREASLAKGIKDKVKYEIYLAEESRKIAERKESARKYAIKIAKEDEIRKEQETARLERQKTIRKMERERKKEQCKTDLKCWGRDNEVNAIVGCQRQIERMAKYTFKWLDTGWFSSKFSHYRWKDKNRLIVTYIGDKIQFQNGFGAYQNMIYECDYATEQEVVYDVRAKPGRL